MNGPERDLVAEEGVDEGSADSVVEGERSGAGGVLGQPARSPAPSGPGDGPPEEVETEESRAARVARGTGQQLQEGEG
jgi:hypothetical protein